MYSPQPRPNPQAGSTPEREATQVHITPRLIDRPEPQAAAPQPTPEREATEVHITPRLIDRLEPQAKTTDVLLNALPPREEDQPSPQMQPEGPLILRVVVRGPESPYDDPNAAANIVVAILKGQHAKFVHEQETMVSYVWQGAHVRKPQTILEISTQTAQIPAIMQILNDLHPDRNPEVQTIVCAAQKIR